MYALLTLNIKNICHEKLNFLKIQINKILFFHSFAFKLYIIIISTFITQFLTTEIKNFFKSNILAPLKNIS